MDTEAFKTALVRDGYADVELRSLPAGLFNDLHSHDFDVRALMLAGELLLTWDGREHTFGPGEVFTMEAGCPHTERLGPAGAQYLVGRRHAAV